MGFIVVRGIPFPSLGSTGLWGKRGGHQEICRMQPLCRLSQESVIIFPVLRPKELKIKMNILKTVFSGGFDDIVQQNILNGHIIQNCFAYRIAEPSVFEICDRHHQHRPAASRGGLNRGNIKSDETAVGPCLKTKGGNVSKQRRVLHYRRSYHIRESAVNCFRIGI